MSASINISSGILHHKVYKSDRSVRLLLHIMLLIAEEEAALASDAIRESGVLVRSAADLAHHLHWSRSAVVRALDLLKAADAIKTRAVREGTEIRCLYYSAVLPAGAEVPKKKPKVPRSKAPVEERAMKFANACRSVCDAEPTRLPEALRAEFYAYWTEQNATGSMRFELQPFFDHGRRMDTWRRNAESRGPKPVRHQPTPPSRWNPRG